MTCQDVQKFVYVYLDGEFGPSDKAEYEAHVAACGPCREAVTSERGFRLTLRTHLTPLSAPSHLKGLIVEKLATAEIETRRPAQVPLVVRLSPVLALAAAVLLVLYWPRARTSAAPTPTAHAGFSSAAASANASPGWSGTPVVPASYPQVTSAGYVTAASTSDSREVDAETAMTLMNWQHVPAAIRGGEATIRRYLEPRVGFRVSAPLDESVRLKLVGARQVSAGGRPAVLFVYDFGGERVTVVSRPGPEVPGSPALLLQKVGTLTMGQFERGGTYNLVLSDLEPAQIHAILPGAARRR